MSLYEFTYDIDSLRDSIILQLGDKSEDISSGVTEATISITIASIVDEAQKLTSYKGSKMVVEGGTLLDMVAITDDETDVTTQFLTQAGENVANLLHKRLKTYTNNDSADGNLVYSFSQSYDFTPIVVNAIEN